MYQYILRLIKLFQKSSNKNLYSILIMAKFYSLQMLRARIQHKGYFSMN